MNANELIEELTKLVDKMPPAGECPVVTEDSLGISRLDYNLGGGPVVLKLMAGETSHDLIARLKARSQRSNHDCLECGERLVQVSNSTSAVSRLIWKHSFPWLDRDHKAIPVQP